MQSGHSDSYYKTFHASNRPSGIAMSRKPTHIIVNPASAGGRTGKRSAEINAAINKFFGKDYSLFVTERPLEASESAARAVRDGAELVIAVGGDGTLQEVVNGLFLNGHLINPQCQFGVVSSGTGKGFAQSTGLPASLDGQMQLIHDAQGRLIDVGRVDFFTVTGTRSHRYFLNECQCGIGGEVVRAVQHSHKRLGGTLGFGLGTIETTFRYKNQPMIITKEDGTSRSGLITGIVVANGEFTGGGMNLAPGARMDDGLLDVLLMHNLTIFRRLMVYPRIYSGTHIRTALFSYFRASCLTVESAEQVLVEADGELLGTTPCTITILPSQLLVRI